MNAREPQPLIVVFVVGFAMLLLALWLGEP